MNASNTLETARPIESIYIHVPFCERKCTYCDFYSIESTQYISDFVETVIEEIHLRLNTLPEPPIPKTIFFGGGTPTLLTPEQMARILDALPVPAANAEITMEANPGTVTLDKLSAYRSLGVNRLSIGIQSFQVPELEFLTRIHNARQAAEAVALARSAGFDNVNIDLMFALPNQTIQSLSDTLDKAIALEPDHISSYSLIYEHGTPLFRNMKKGLVTPTSDDIDADMYQLVTTRLADAGYQQYEVSNYAKPGKQCNHNLAYWHARSHLSVGPSAHGLINGTRYWNHRSLTSWQALVRKGSLPHANTETLSLQERLEELLFLTLRADGIPFEHIRDEFQFDVRTALTDLFALWMESGFAFEDDASLRLTHSGYAICDELTVQMMTQVEAHWVQKERGER